MKKILTFTNFIALFAFITLMLFFTPCIQFVASRTGVKPLINLFQAAFGTSIINPSGLSTLEPIKVATCAGLVIAFVFLIVGILLSIGKNKIKHLGYLASAFYITSGILIACAVPLVKNTNYFNTFMEMTYKINYYGWTYAIATLVLLVGVTAFFETIATTTKPKVQEVY